MPSVCSPWTWPVQSLTASSEKTPIFTAAQVDPASAIKYYYFVYRPGPLPYKTTATKFPKPYWRVSPELRL